MAQLCRLVGRLQEASPDRFLVLNPMVACSAPPIALCIHKNVDRNETAPCVCCMLPASVIAVTASCGQSARKVFPPGNHDESAPSIGLSLNPRVPFLRLPCSDHQNRYPCPLLSSDRSQSFGTIGLAAAFGGGGCTWYAPKP